MELIHLYIHQFMQKESKFVKADIRVYHVARIILRMICAYPKILM